MTNENSNACRHHSFDLHYTQPPICPSATARRQLTRDCLVKQKKAAGRLTRPTTVVVDDLKICGRKLHVGSAESRTFYIRPTAFDNELRVLNCSDHYDSARKFERNSATHPSLAAANDHRFNCCDEESPEDNREVDERQYVNDDYSVCQPSKPSQACQKVKFISEQDITNECLDTGGAEADMLHSSEATYRNVRIDQNRMLKLLRKFDTIRQRARAAREDCLLRLEMRQKQRLHLLNLTDIERQQKSDGREVLGKAKSLPLDETDTAATWNDVGVQGTKDDVKMRDVIVLCDPTRTAKFQTTWPPALDDSPINFEPTNAVISRLMSQFEQIRLNSATARLKNQQCFDIKRRQRKYYK